MNIIRYFISKNYRKNLNENYTKDICNKFLYEEMKHEEIYSMLLSNLTTNRKNSA